MKTHSGVLAFVLLLALLGLPAWGLKPGEVAPRFSGTGLDAKPISSTDFSGKVVVLTFWATWCPSCREELRQLQALEQDLKDKGLVVLAANEREDPVQVADFLSRAGVTLEVLLDDGQSARAFGVNGLPDLLILDRTGALRQRIIGYGPEDPAQIRKAVQPLLVEPKKPPGKPSSSAASRLAESRLPATLRAYAHLQLGAAHLNIADAFTRRGYPDGGHYAEAARELRAGLALDPKSVGLNVWLGLVLERTGDRAEAETRYRAALALDPTSVDAVEGLRRLTQAPAAPPALPEPPD